MFVEGYGIIVRERWFFDVSEFYGVPDPHRVNYFIENPKTVREQIDRIKKDSLAEQKHFFVNCIILAQQHFPGPKASISRVIDTGKRLTDVKLHSTSSTA